MSSPPHFPILLAEDSDDDLFLFRRLLAKAAISNPLQLAANGQAAIDLLAAAIAADPANLPRIVFLDLKLPLRSGFEVLRWIRGQPDLRHLAAIVLSSSAEARDVQRAFMLGAQAYLVKYPPATVFREIVDTIAALPMDHNLEGIQWPGLPRP